jgi:hypothetical protein
MYFSGKEISQRREPHLLNLGDIATHFGLGSGANIGADSTDFYTKYVCSSMSHTNQQLPLLFRQALSVDKRWTDIEVYRSGKYGYESVGGSRLSFVPKSRTISRTICTEPLLNMLFQKGIAGVLSRRLIEVYGLDFSSQPSRNARLARIGSMTGEYGTIDLSSASDTISLRMLEEMLPPEPLNWLKRVRSPSTTLPGGAEVPLHMISSMGNGYTFPLQTLIFACLVAATYRILDIPIRKPKGGDDGNFAVFGDDIIVKREAFGPISRCLEILGFSVNRNKSFNEGPFRESCGSDFYHGCNVRGVYLKTLKHASDFYSAINRLNRWSATHGVLLRRIIGNLRSGCRFLGVPYDEADDAGIKIPLSLLHTVRTDRNGAICYLASVNVVRSVRIPDVEPDATITPALESEIRRELPSFEYHGEGLLWCFVAGFLRSGRLGLRTISKKAVLRRRVCPGWDERIAALGVTPASAEAWKSFVTANLVISPSL